MDFEQDVTVPTACQKISTTEELERTLACFRESYFESLAVIQHRVCRWASSEKLFKAESEDQECKMESLCVLKDTEWDLGQVGAVAQVAVGRECI